MYPTKSSEILRSALSLLPPLPCSVNVLSQEGGSFSMTLAAVDGDLVYAYGARALVNDDVVLEARLRDDRDEGWDIHFSIVRTYFQSGDDLLLHLNVVSVEPRTAERAAARAHLSELAVAKVVYTHSYEAGERFDVRLADASPTGAAFVTERRLWTGDRLELETVIDNQPVRFEVRVVHSAPAVYGRNRVGCEITSILEADRHLLLRLAERYHGGDSADQRDPALAKQRAAARGQQTLNSRRKAS
jgi:PilZ domain-containing protein